MKDQGNNVDWRGIWDIFIVVVSWALLLGFVWVCYQMVSKSDNGPEKTTLEQYGCDFEKNASGNYIHPCSKQQIDEIQKDRENEEYDGRTPYDGGARGAL